MNRTANINMRVEPQVKIDAECILNGLGLSTTDAINIFLKQVVLHNGLPFNVRYPSEEKLEAEKILLAELKEGRDSVKSESDWLTIEESKQLLKDRKVSRA